MKNPTEIDREFLIKMHSMYRVKEAPYCPVVVYFPYYNDKELKWKFKFLYNRLENAYRETIKQFPGCFDAELVERKDSPFRELVYLNPDKQKAVSLMYEILEGMSVVDYEAEEYYDWSYFCKYFITLQPDEVRLYDNEKLNVFFPENAELYEACKKADLTAIKAAVENGATVNGFCEFCYGEAHYSPIQVLLGTVINYDDGKVKIHYSDSEIQNVIKCIEYLLEQGGDINLYAFGDDDVLINTFESGSEKLICFMFQHGLKVQQNSNVLDFSGGYSIYDLYKQCWLSEHYWWQNYEYEEDFSGMEATMKKFGMSEYINNYTYKMVGEIERKLLEFCK